MPITGLDSVLAGFKQEIPYCKTNTVTTVAGVPYTLINRAGYPAAGSLNPSQTTNGAVPTDATTGFPTIAAFGGSNKGYLSRLLLTTNAACSIALYDVLFWAGQTVIPTSGTTTVSLTSRPTFTTRVPYMSDGTTRDWTQVQLFIQASTALSNHAHTTSIDYLDQGGNAGNTGDQSTQNIPVNRLIRCPLASGDYGVQEITGYNVNGATSSTGSVSVLAMRKLCQVRAMVGSNTYGPDLTGLPEVFADSALLAVAIMDSTTSPIFQLDVEIVEA